MTERAVAGSRSIEGAGAKRGVDPDRCIVKCDVESTRWSDDDEADDGNGGFTQSATVLAIDPGTFDAVDGDPILRRWLR